MSTLTKVFVVLLVVCSIAFTVMTVSVVVQQADWRETAEKYEEHARVADANLRNLIAADAAVLATAQDTARDYLRRIADLEARLQASGDKVSKARSEFARASSEKSSSEAINRGLLAQLDACSSGRDGYRSQLGNLEKRSVELERRNIDLNDRVNEQTAQIAVMLEQKRQMEQQLHIVKNENEKLAREARRLASGQTLEDPSGIAMTNITAATPVSPTAIRGQVVEVAGELVTISVGEADGVRKNMVFVIHRDDKYVGDLKITLVDPGQAAGRLSSATGTPVTGDMVTDAARLGRSRG